jgi:hypothetical protein
LSLEQEDIPEQDYWDHQSHVVKKYLLTLWQYSRKKLVHVTLFPKHRKNEGWKETERQNISERGKRGEHAQFALVSLTTENIEMYSGLIWKLRSFRKMREGGPSAVVDTERSKETREMAPKFF